MCLCVLTHACAECSHVPDLIFHRKTKSVLSCLREKQNKNSAGQISSPLHSSRWQTVIEGGACQPSVSEVCSSGDCGPLGAQMPPEGVFELLEEPGGQRADGRGGRREEQQEESESQEEGVVWGD